MFKPVTTSPQLTDCKCNVTCMSTPIMASDVTFDDERNNIGVDLSGNDVPHESGQPPEIMIRFKIEDIVV